MTISMDEETARWARVAAAERDMSVSRFISELLRREMAEDAGYRTAMESFLAEPQYVLGEPGAALPAREALYDRPGLR